MKKAISIALLFLFVYQTLGYFVIFKILQANIRHEIKEKIESSLSEDQLEIITIKTDEENQIEWVREGKEFIYKNKMYDVVRKKEKDNTIKYFCLNDKKEEELFANLDDIVRKNPQNDKNIKNILSKVVNNYFFEDVNMEKGIFIAEIVSPRKTSFYNNLERKVQNPPPKFA